ncbi:short-chain dehydrogenase/reductase-like protein [Byssothecium circinans]|uniref:Short-chain dehydrogenase/reductase-like protein n=1 Tax=Byssothecium circinans TaxID=147558 RepID=A0A6A5U2V1_9PLEO|nr:short-chain dehydrogenase/reductase-like protein [Byssothecium circinans]
MPFLELLYSQLFAPIPKPTASYAGQTIIVTGSNVGLGKEAARHFTRLGASTVILAVRSMSKGEAAKADIEKTTNTTDVVKVWHLDMGSYQSVLDFASKASKELQRLDIAVLNAGVARGEWEIMEQDESTITVNVVSTFLLALSLLPKMKETANTFNKRPTLTIVASDIHIWAKFEEGKAPDGKIFEALNMKPAEVGEAAMLERYRVSKLLDILGTRAIADRKAAQQIPVTVNCVTPGLCHSELSREAGIGLTIMKFFFAQSTEVGSRTLVHAGSAGAETHGHYLADCKIQKPSDFVLSAEGYKTQNLFWEELSNKLEGIKPGVTANL